MQSDFRDAMQDMEKREQYREQMDFKRDESIRRDSMSRAKMDIDREKLQTQRDIAATNLEIARENKNKYDVKGTDKEKE